MAGRCPKEVANPRSHSQPPGTVEVVSGVGSREQFSWPLGLTAPWCVSLPREGVAEQGCLSRGRGGWDGRCPGQETLRPGRRTLSSRGHRGTTVHRRPASRRILTKPQRMTGQRFFPPFTRVSPSQTMVCGFCDVHPGDILKPEKGSAPGGETAHGSCETPPWPRTLSGTGRPSRVVGMVRGHVHVLRFHRGISSSPTPGGLSGPLYGLSPS